MILVNNPGDWSALYPPLAHAPWHGVRPTELVFPFFLFAVGLLLNAAPFVRWDAAGELVLRDWASLRLMGVLQRIALCFGAAALIVCWLGRRGALVATALLLLGYWWACGLSKPDRAWRR